MQLADTRAGDVRDLAAQGKDGLRCTVARLFGGAASAVAFDEEYLRAVAAVLAAVCQLAGKAELARRGFARCLLLLPLLQTVFGLIDDKFEELVCFLRILREPVVEVILDHVLDQTLCIGR